ncbi:MAG: hypothetical protein N2512_09180 [Armatimonadetes bacterium]|nr:hypothetical protein [Armatimonadota bacterium]
MPRAGHGRWPAVLSWFFRGLSPVVIPNLAQFTEIFDFLRILIRPLTRTYSVPGSDRSSS